MRRLVRNGCRRGGNGRRGPMGRRRPMAWLAGRSVRPISRTLHHPWRLRVRARRGCELILRCAGGLRSKRGIRRALWRRALGRRKCGLAGNITQGGRRLPGTRLRHRTVFRLRSGWLRSGGVTRLGRRLLVFLVDLSSWRKGRNTIEPHLMRKAGPAVHMTFTIRGEVCKRTGRSRLVGKNRRRRRGRRRRGRRRRGVVARRLPRRRRRR